MQRRHFNQLLAGTLVAAATPRYTSAAPAKMRILILGGTRFIGLYMVRQALARGHTVTLFNRGQTNPGLFPELEKLKGDRDGQLDALRGRQWDCVIDDSGYVPRHVQLSTALLAPSVQQYLYISSISAYASFATPNDENSPLAVLRRLDTEEINGDTYGPFKAIAETHVRAAFPAGAVIVRPGFVVGPEDYTGRFTFWPAFAARGGDLPLPGKPGVPMQFIDVRELARFAIQLLEQRHAGTFNVVSPPGAIRTGDVVSACIASAKHRAHPATPPRAIWMPAGFIEKQGVTLSSAFPLWPGNPDETALARVSAARALSAGLKLVPVRTTVDDTMVWYLSLPQETRDKVLDGYSVEQQQKLLAAWHQR